jgi:hypothetical protein
LNNQELNQELDAQDAKGRLQPGEPGWWQVWGASVQDIEPGDAVVEAGTGGEWFYVQDVFQSNSPWLRLGIVVDGERQTIGIACPIGLMRRGTKNTLAASVR